MDILTILFGALGLIVAGILFVAFKKRALISQTLNASMALKQAQKELEKELYDKELKKQMPDMVKAKVAKDIEKKLNKKSFAEKLSEASKELTKNAKSGGMEHKGIDSVMNDLNVFSASNKNELKNAKFLDVENSNDSKKPFDLNDLTLGDLYQAQKYTENSGEIGGKRRAKRKK